MKLQVINPDGSVEVLEVTADATGQQLKEKCRVVIEHNELQTTAAAANADVEGSSVDPVPNTSFQYKLICVGLTKGIKDESRIGDQGLKDTDKLLLLKQRSAPKPKPEKRNHNPNVEETNPEDLQTPEESAPAQDVIDEATRNIAKRNLEKNAWKEKGPSSGMTSELARLKGRLAYRQGFITLIQIAHRLQCTDPKAASAVKEALANAKLAAMEKARIPMVNPDALKQLRDMGFPEIASRKALAANNMSVEPAMEWLLQHTDDKDYNNPLPLPESAAAGESTEDNNNSMPQTNKKQDTFMSSVSEIHAPTEGVTHSTNSGADTGAGIGVGTGTGGITEEDSSSSDASTSKDAESINPEETLRIFQEFRNRPRKQPPEIALHLLQSMGFDKEESTEALAVNNNNHKTAMEWLLGGRKPRFEELNRPLDEQSKLHQELTKNPVILMGLTKVRTLLALEHLTHCPEALEFWLNDLEVGQVLTELNQIISMDFDFDDESIEMAIEALDLLNDDDDDDDDTD